MIQVPKDSSQQQPLTAHIKSGLNPLNYPLFPPPGVNFTQHVLAPPGFVLHLQLSHVGEVATNGQNCAQVISEYL